MRLSAHRVSTLGICSIAVAAVLGAGSATRADVVVLQATKDNTLYQLASGVASNGAGDHVFAGRTSDSLRRRGLIAFNVAGAIPAGSTINSVTLTLYCSKVKNGQARSIAVHRVSADWGEGTSHAAGEEGAGAPPTTGDATWQHRFYATTFWAVAGGDYLPGASHAVSVTGTGTYNWSSVGMRQDVAFWLANPASNFGWILIGDEAVDRTAKRFDSRQNPVVAQRPRLTVDFTPPAPTGACCTGATCQLLTQSACTTAGGTFQGVGTTCSPNPCFVPTGACCADNGTCTVLTETQCDAQGGTFQGDGSTCAAAECPIVLTPYMDALPRPAVATPVSGTVGGAASYDMTARETQQQLHAQLAPTTVWGYDDGVLGPGYPGPTIEAARGQTVNVNWINDLRDTATGLLRTDHYLDVDTACIHGAENTAKIVVHLHGGHVAEASDGYPEATFEPGFQDTYTYPNQQLPATLWYHDHALGITRLNVYMGLAGYFLLRDPFEQALGLPAGEFEVPLALQDRKFKTDGSFDYPAAWQDHFFGDKILVNGKVWPYLTVKQGKYRFRVLNGSTSRTYTLALAPPTGTLNFTVIGTDGGLLESPITGLGTLTLGPGERYEVVVDFAGQPAGAAIYLENSAPRPYPNGTLDVTEVMRFDVIGQPGHTAALPPTLRPIERLLANDAVRTRDFRLARGANDGCGRQPWLINDLHWDDITEYPELGTTEIWRFINDSGVSHPMHMHLVMFQILDRDGFTVGGSGEIIPDGNPMPPAPHENGWKDTAMVGPGQILRVIARFENYAGKYAYHCHILEHEDHEMMRQFQTVAPIAVTLNGGDVLWGTTAGATSYDVVRGDLTSLRASGGQFSVATTACLANNTTSTSVSHAGTPSAGEGYWYLVRRADVSGNGTYDSGASSQVARRDPGILASGNDCP